MEGPSYAEFVEQLYEVVEVNLQGVLIPVAAETLRLVNPGLQPQQALEIATDADSRAAGNLSKADFADAVRIVLQNTEAGDALRAVKDVVLRLRVGVRRRYLMYDAPPNTFPPQIADNGRAQQSFRDLFDTISAGDDVISREQLRTMTKTVLFDAPVEASLVVKCAVGNPASDLIGFQEFTAVMQQAARHRHLSDMLILMQNRIQQIEADRSPVQKQQRDGSELASGTLRPPPAVAAKLVTHNLAREVETLKQQEYLAERRYQHAMGSPVQYVLPTVPVLPQETKEKLNFNQESMDAEVSKLRLENAELRRELLQYEMEKSMVRSPSANPTAHSSYDEGEVNVLRQKINELENELRISRAHLNTARESGSLLSALQSGVKAHAVVRDYFPDEATLCSKHQYLRETASLVDDGKSPISVVLGQYDLIVVGYQSLYRELRKKYEASRPRKFDVSKAAASIVAGTPPPPEALQQVQRRTQSPVRVASSPLRWSDLDREPADDMKKTGMLADPLLTREQRNFLREKLAAQMRRSARNYKPPSQRAVTPTREATVMTSLDAMQRLQQITDKATRDRRLDSPLRR